MKLTMPFKLLDWIDDNREHLKPPVCNKEMFADGGFIVQVVGGPNSRTDYHVDEGPELFYQVEGEMVLKTVQDEQFVDIRIGEGVGELADRVVRMQDGHVQEIHENAARKGVDEVEW